FFPTGPPKNTGTSADPAGGAPETSSATGRSSGRLMITPSAPSCASCSETKSTVRRKFGSSMLDEQQATSRQNCATSVHHPNHACKTRNRVAPLRNFIRCPSLSQSCDYSSLSVELRHGKKFKKIVQNFVASRRNLA